MEAKKEEKKLAKLRRVKNEAVSSRRFVIPKNPFQEAINSSTKVTAVVHARRAFTVAWEISGGEQLSGILHRSERRLRASRIHMQLLEVRPAAGQTAATRLWWA